MGILLSIVLLGKGFVTGLVLTLMIGPVTMIILRHGIQAGRTGGLMAAAGTWVSDLVFIPLTFYMTAALQGWLQHPANRVTIYVAGGTGLLLVGLMMLRVKRVAYDISPAQSILQHSRAFAGGFMINSVSPFTLFFWLGAAIYLHMQSAHPLWYYTGVMAVLMAGDNAKAWLAPKLALWLEAKYVYWVQVGAGILIGATGVYGVILGLMSG